MHLSKLNLIIQKCDVCLSTLSKDFKSDNFPGKILRYMINNKPILVHSPKNEFLQNLIEKNSLGLYSSEEKNYLKILIIFFQISNHLRKMEKTDLTWQKNIFPLSMPKKFYLKTLNKFLQKFRY